MTHNRTTLVADSCLLMLFMLSTVVGFNIVMLSAPLQNAIVLKYAELLYAEPCFAGQLHAKCHNAEFP